MWLFSSAPEDPEDDTVMEKHVTKTLHSVGNRLMHAIQTEDQYAQYSAAHCMMHFAKAWMRGRWSEMKIANEKPLVLILMGNPHIVDFEWAAEEQSILMTIMETSTSRGASGAWRVHSWRLEYISLVSGNTKDRNDVSGQ
jgi:hypothetical protein